MAEPRKMQSEPTSAKCSLKRRLFALEIAESATIEAATTSAAAAAAVTKASASTATSSTTAPPTARSASASTSTVVVTRCRVVQTRDATLNGDTIHRGECFLGLVDGAEFDVAEALGLSTLTVGGESDTNDRSVFAELIANDVRGSGKGNVGDEDRRTRLTELTISVLVGTFFPRLSGGSRLGEVNIDRATINLLAIHGGLSFLAVGQRAYDVFDTVYSTLPRRTACLAHSTLGSRNE